MNKSCYSLKYKEWNLYYKKKVKVLRFFPNFKVADQHLARIFKLQICKHPTEIVNMK